MRKRPSAEERAEKQSRTGLPIMMLPWEDPPLFGTGMAKETQTSAPATGWPFSSTTSARQRAGRG